MTRETRTLIEITDMWAVEFTCPHCGTRYSVAFDKSDRQLLTHCPNCREPWLDDERSSEKSMGDMTVVMAFMHHAREIQKRKCKSLIRIELKSEEQHQ